MSLTITTLFVNSHNAALGLMIFKETSINSSEVSQNDIFYSFCCVNCLNFHGHKITLFWFQVDRICFKVFCGDSQNVAWSCGPQYHRHGYLLAERTGGWPGVCPGTRAGHPHRDAGQSVHLLSPTQGQSVW